MADSFRVELSRQTKDHVDLDVGFVGSAGNDRRVLDAIAAIRALELAGGPLIKFNGPSSLPVAMALAHEVAHLYGAVAVWDPKLSKYVIVISHRPDLKPGELID